MELFLTSSELAEFLRRSETVAHGEGFRIVAIPFERRLSPTMRQTHVAGHKAFVDYSGKKVPIVDPLTGNGMAMAIQSAAVAAPHVLRAVEGKRDEAAYRHAHAGFFGRRIRWSRRVAMILSRPALLDAALAAVRSPGAGRFLLTHTRASLEAAPASRLSSRFPRLPPPKSEPSLLCITPNSATNTGSPLLPQR